MPIVMIALQIQSAASFMPGGLTGAIVGSYFEFQAGIMIKIGETVFNLLLYSLSIAVVNYFFTDEANFITLTTYFAFIEAVTRVIIYTLIISALLAAVIAPPFLAVVGLLVLAFVIWSIALNIIVLMSAYGYGIFSAFLLGIGAYVVRKLIYVFVSGLLGTPLDEILYSS